MPPNTGCSRPGYALVSEGSCACDGSSWRRLCARPARRLNQALGPKRRLVVQIGCLCYTGARENDLRADQRMPSANRHAQTCASPEGRLRRLGERQGNQSRVSCVLLLRLSPPLKSIQAFGLSIPWRCSLSCIPLGVRVTDQWKQEQVQCEVEDE